MKRLEKGEEAEWRVSGAELVSMVARLPLTLRKARAEVLRAAMFEVLYIVRDV
jgi:hypothetical protein